MEIGLALKTPRGLRCSRVLRHTDAMGHSVHREAGLFSNLPNELVYQHETLVSALFKF